MKRVVIAVISYSGGWYPELTKCALETWAKDDVPGAEPIFYFDSDYKGSFPKSIKLNHNGGLFGMGRRNLLAFDWLLKHKEWDYLARVNSSCYVRQERLRDYVQNIPEKGLYRGLVTAAPHGGKYCWGGGGFIISRDVVQEVVKNGFRMDHREMEDVSLGLLVQKIGFQLDGMGRMCSIDHQPVGYVCIVYNDGAGGGFNFTDFADMKKMDGQHFIRIKQEGKRPHGDIAVMRELKKQGL